MYKIYLNDNNNKNIKETLNILEENLEEYVIYRNETDMNEEYIIEECNDIRVNMYLSINISKEEKNKIYYNKNNSYSYYIYNTPLYYQEKCIFVQYYISYYNNIFSHC